ncbi:MAG: VOC family protein [Treponema sp.]
MKMNSVVIRTDNMEKSLAFYEKIIGLTFESMISAAPGKRIAFLYDSQSGNRLEIIQNEQFKQKPVHSVSLTFIVDQIGETEKYLQSKGVPITMMPRTVKDGKKMLTATDPNGVEIDFIELKRAQ